MVMQKHGIIFWSEFEILLSTVEATQIAGSCVCFIEVICISSASKADLTSTACLVFL